MQETFIIFLSEMDTIEELISNHDIGKSRYYYL